MSRDRDPFERTLDVLRQRLRAGDYGLGQPLHIHKLASAMAVSSTPVREALARLSGEGLIVRAPSGYLTHRYDVEGLRGLYHLDQIYALAKPTGSRSEPIGASRPGPAEEDYVTRTEALLSSLARQEDRALVIARAALWDRLAPFRALEPSVLPDLEPEAAHLAQFSRRGSEPAPAALIRAYYRKRQRAAEALLKAAMARKESSNIP